MELHKIHFDNVKNYGDFTKTKGKGLPRYNQISGCLDAL